jgi:hypothetical protein
MLEPGYKTANDWRPQIRFDGLTVGVRFGGAASIERTAIAVDETLPSLYRPGTLQPGIEALVAADPAGHRAAPDKTQADGCDSRAE